MLWSVYERSPDLAETHDSSSATALSWDTEAGWATGRAEALTSPLEKNYAEM
jgi:hypothetical protein